jgi:hypothetical protein
MRQRSSGQCTGERTGQPVLLDSRTLVRVYGAGVRAGEVARRAGVNAATLRYYERRGLPFLGPALRRLLEELPAPGDGLSGTERRALRAVAEGATTPVAAFLAAQNLEAAPCLGDAWFFRALAGIGVGPARLVETQAGDPLPPPPPLGDARAFARLPLRLTGPGERVLDGVQDRVALLGLDRWLGGTHLTAAAPWRWDPAAGLLVPPA